jgi:septal ring-binding cell division protein DamX
MSLETPPTPPAAPAPPPQQPAPRACPRCGAGLAPDQEWCLNCGADVGARIAETPRWRVPILIVGVLLVAALGAVALALIELADDDQQVAQAPTQTAAPTPAATPPQAPTGEQPAPGEAGATPGAQVPEASDSATAPGQSGDATATPENEGDSTNPSGTATPGASASPSPSPSPGSGAGSSGTIASWPSGKTAWTVVLESATSKSAADAKANELSSDGTSVGVLHSDDFSSLNSGYWVVFSGQYDSKSAAQDALDSLKSKVPEAYVRHVVPK